jgi:hypothetical protein
MATVAGTPIPYSIAGIRRTPADAENPGEDADGQAESEHEGCGDAHVAPQRDYRREFDGLHPSGGVEPRRPVLRAGVTEAHETHGG